jgi:hypothetical protein|tara:strand:- start:278 stop:604 length:327 start_codon:yes stop_codon:yes gene_type:complete
MYSKEQIKKAFEDEVIVDDGHTLMDPKYYVGFDVDHLIEVHKSDFSSGKSTIFTDGVPVEELEAVYNLDFLRMIVHQLGLECDERYMGRGFQAHEYCRKLREFADVSG